MKSSLNLVTIPIFSTHAYLNKMVHGNQWATSTEISVAIRILQNNINQFHSARIAKQPKNNEDSFSKLQSICC
jgi:hypothetical protein